uniref:BESS domain-containing protein n=1 Tax=Parastrongyloides trichosuri TaxID=131310 RepID=A0A0N4ZQP2_PARTI
MDNPSPPLNNTTRGRPRKDVSASLIEVRTKLLQIPEANEYNGKTLYELARLYMYGNRKKTNGKEIWDNSHFHNQFYNNSMDMEDSNSSLHDSLDLLATKDILELPKPKKDIPLPPKWPTPIKNDDESVVDIEDKDNILKNHVKHWKKVRQTWLDHNRRKHPQHYRSIQLLETVYGMSQSSFSS